MNPGTGTRTGVPEPAGSEVGKSSVPFLSWRNLVECMLGALGICLMCLLGESFYKVSGTLAAPLWPSSGLALGILLLRGWRLFPAISLGTVTATTFFGDPHIFSLFGSLANSIESLIGWFLMARVFGFSNSLSSIRDVVVLMLAGAPWGTHVSAILCTLGLIASGSVNYSALPLSLLLFWTGNILGILIFTPLTLWVAMRLRRAHPLRISPMSALWALIVLSVLVFGFSVTHTAHTGLIPLGYLTFPLMLWLSHSWKRDMIPLLAAVTVVMIIFTVTKHGPLLRDSQFATYAEMTMFISIYGISCLLLMAAVVESEKNSRLAHQNQISLLRSEAELQSLRNNLNPHFLFNSLNVLKALIHEDPDKALHAVNSLAELLRSALRVSRHDFIPFQEELDIIDAYLDLQKIRFEERLEVGFSIAPETRHIPVPPMLFHQLVENAVKHGVEKSTSGGRIKITSRVDRERLELQVANDGTILFEGEARDGIRIIRQQLEVLFGNAATFELRTTQDHRVIAGMKIPLTNGNDGIEHLSGNSRG